MYEEWETLMSFVPMVYGDIRHYWYDQRSKNAISRISLSFGISDKF